jgi:ribonucleoside-diphosphate reductase alpha subunit
MSSHILFRNLNVSDRAKDIAQTIFQSTNQQVTDAGIRAIIDSIYNYSDMCLAGRLLIYEVARAVPSVKIYLILNKTLLADHIVSFMEANLDYFEKIVADSEYWNYDNHDYFSAKTLCETYLLKSSFEHRPTETPVLKNLRIATALYHDYSNNLESNLRMISLAFDQMNQSYYTHASPTIFNAGTKTPQMASCFLGAIDDSLDHMLYTGCGDMGMISRYNGAIGFTASNIRHSGIAGTGKSSGVLPYLRVIDRMIGYVDQGGKRKGAATAFLDIWHYDIEAFVEASSNYIDHDLRLKNLHTAVWMHNLFYERCFKNEDWTVFCPKTAPGLFGSYNDEFEEKYVMYEKLALERETEYLEAEKQYLLYRRILADGQCTEEEYLESVNRFQKARKERIIYKKIPAPELMNHIVDIQIKSGKPYVVNGDRANFKTNHMNIGKVNNSNLCVEIIEVSDTKTFASCNLASINLPRYSLRRFNHSLDSATDSEIIAELAECFDFETFAIMARSIVRNLNQIIDKNFYPLDPSKIKVPNLLSRPLGIGVSGLDDAFKMVDIAYMSRAATLLNKMIFACLYYNAIQQSVELAKLDGEYPLYRTGSYRQWNDSSKSFDICQGSPMSNGKFQFDMWQDEYLYNKHLGRVRAPYDPADNIPLEPRQWQPSLSKNVSWETLRRQMMEFGLRNSLFVAVMPTASTAQIMRNSESTEAPQQNIYSRKVLSGYYTVVSRHLYKDLEEIGLNNNKIIDSISDNRGSLQGLTDLIKKYPVLREGANWNSEVEARLRFLEEKYRGMFEIKMSHYLQMTRQRGIYVDQSQSTNAYMVDPTIQQRIAYQVIAHNLHLKTCMYYLRNNVGTTNSGFNKTISSLLGIQELGESATTAKVEDTVVETPKNPESPVAMCKMEEGCVSCSS